MLGTSNGAGAATQDDAHAVGALLAAPDARIDFVRAKLIIDKRVDPKVDVDARLKQIDGMVATVRAMAGPNATTIQKLAAVRRFIYIDGDWNGHRPFRYDLADPLGAKIAHKLLSTYIDTRLGNCVSMPMLFIILADRLGVHVTASTVPSHVFVKFIDDAAGKTYNIETTSGGYPARDVWYRESISMSDAAVANGVYMKTLSRRETVAVMAELVLENDMTAGRNRDVIAVAETILKYVPRDVDAMLAEGTAYAYLMDIEFKRKYPDPRTIPANLVPVYEVYARRNAALFDRAQALGWRETDGLNGTRLPRSRVQ